MEKAYGAETLVPRAQMKEYARRTDRDGLFYLAFHVAALAASGSLVYAADLTWWLLPAMILHGIILAFLFAPMHETGHGTAFRTRWLNELVFRAVSLIYISPPTIFRYYHAAHHTHTHIPGQDPDISLPLPRSLYQYFRYVSAIPFWRRNITWMISFALGRPNEREMWFMPRDEWPRAMREARIQLAIYAALAAASVALGTPALLFYWLLPRLLAEPFMRWIRIAEHIGCEDSGNLLRNTRTTRAAWWFHLLFWNMSYHAEHHLCPAAPFHALARIHRDVGPKLHPVGSGYIAVHRDILRALWQGRGAERIELA